MKVIAAFSFALAGVFARGANAVASSPGTGAVPECRVPHNPKILEFGSPPTGTPINYGSPSPFTIPPSKPPTQRPTNPPTASPTEVPTDKPSKFPTEKPTKPPSEIPTRKPTKVPTKRPSRAPTKRPTRAPSKKPTKLPTRQPTRAPTKLPTRMPTKQPTKAPSQKPSKLPTRQPTKYPSKPPTKAPTKLPTRVPSKSPTQAPTMLPTTKPSLQPTKAPTKATATENCGPAVALLDQQYGTISYSKNPITIVPGSQTGSTVTVSIEQVWKSSSISWIATRFTDPGLGATVCPKKNEVSPGFVSYSSSGGGGAYELKYYSKTYGTQLTAGCVNGFATIEVYVHDGQFSGQPDITVPTACSPSNDSSKKIGYKFTVPCDACPTGGAGPAQVTGGTKAPTSKTPTKAPTRQPASPTKSPVKSPTKRPTRGKSWS